MYIQINIHFNISINLSDSYKYVLNICMYRCIYEYGHTQGKRNHSTQLNMIFIFIEYIYIYTHTHVHSYLHM